jgi:hypothetical protein
MEVENTVSLKTRNIRFLPMALTKGGLKQTGGWKLN